MSTMSPDQITTQDFLAWCKTKPADERYNYLNDQTCAFAQYLRARGINFRYVDGYEWRDTSGHVHPIGEPLETLLVRASTFGALATRIEELSQ